MRLLDKGSSDNTDTIPNFSLIEKRLLLWGQRKMGGNAQSIGQEWLVAPHQFLVGLRHRQHGLSNVTDKRPAYR
jgi:hypothetical protein